MNRISNTSERLQQYMRETNTRQVDIIKKCQPYCDEYGIRLKKNDLSQYVSGKSRPGQERLTILSLALNVSEVWLMGYDIPRERNIPIIKDHQEINRGVLYGIQLILKENGHYKLDVFANKFQVHFNDSIITLSPEDMLDLINSSANKIDYVMSCIIKNRLNDNLSDISDDYRLENSDTLEKER